jgi:parvulin-like peptidyl-prolyl isomerase
LGAAAILGIVLAAGAAVPLRAQVLDRVIAVVSGTVIMLSDARAALTLGLFDAGGAADPIESAMRWLIDRQLVLDEAARGDRLEIAPADLARALAGVRARFASDAEYRRALVELGLDDRGLERLVRETLIARLYVERRFDSMLPPTDEELRAYYAAHADRFVRNGLQLSFEDALADVTAILRRERHDQAVSAWMDRLRRRADIREVYRASR